MAMQHRLQLSAVVLIRIRQQAALLKILIYNLLKDASSFMEKL
jgi:hypothetical protein